MVTLVTVGVLLVASILVAVALALAESRARSRETAVARSSSLIEAFLADRDRGPNAEAEERTSVSERPMDVSPERS